jgi:hypothetical protein
MLLAALAARVDLAVRLDAWIVVARVELVREQRPEKSSSSSALM